MPTIADIFVTDKNPVAMTGTNTNTANNARVARSPRTTASVRFPASWSVSRSRRLFTTSTAVASDPTPTAPNKAGAVNTWIWISAVASTPTNPYQTNTDNSPKPWYPYGTDPPV